MSGNSLLIDTNIALYLLNGDEIIAQLLNEKSIYISFITELELLGYQEISEAEKNFIRGFLEDCIVVDLNQAIKDYTIELKQNLKIKLPDAIIAATSQYLDLPLVSADKGFRKIEDLRFVQYEVE